MNFKRFFSGILIVLLLNINFSFAQSWVTISAENGKSAELDLDSIKLAVDTVEYDIKTENDGYLFINKFSTELYKEGTPTAVIQRAKYKDTISEINLISTEKMEKRNYKELKSGTLQSEIFDVLSKELEKRDFSRGKTTWEKYLKKQRKTIYKKSKHYGSWKVGDYITPVYMDESTVIINKDGKIDTEDPQILGLEKLDPLPNDYTAETFELKVDKQFYKYAGAKLYNDKPPVEQISPTKAQITISKNDRPPVIGHIEFGMLGFYCAIVDLGELIMRDRGLLDVILLLPEVIVLIGLWMPFMLTSLLLCLITGVSTDDLL